MSDDTHEAHFAPGAGVRGKAQATLVLERAILDIVEERAPITVRGVCYALFVRKLIPSMEVGQTAAHQPDHDGDARGRDARLDARSSTAAAQSSAPAHGATRTPSSKPPCSSYRRDNWQDQPAVVEVWSEKSTVEGVLAAGARRARRHLPGHEGLRLVHAGDAGGRVDSDSLARQGPEARRPVHRRLGPVRALHERRSICRSVSPATAARCS